MQPLRGAFSLIELLIVVALIVIIYGIAASTMRMPSGAKEEAFSVASLDSKLRAFDGYVKMSCMGEKCERCQLFDSFGEEIGEPFSIFSELPVVTSYDKGGYKESKKYPEPICFEMEKFENGTISEIAFDYKLEHYHYYPVIVPLSHQDRDPADIAPTDTGRYFNEND